MAGGTLFVVATPIGNLEDITRRALRILAEVAVVAAEDTRRTGNLLRHYGITTKLLSLHEHNERERTAGIIARLADGQSVALVSDAGTPGISDPGAVLIRQVREAGYAVSPVPGASSVVAALSASGIGGDRFVFGGFAPVRAKARKQWWEWAAKSADVPFVFFEAPHRVRQTLGEAQNIWGDRPILVAREITKLHEEWLRGTAANLLEQLPEPVGEFVFIVPSSEPTAGVRALPTDAEIAHVFGEITKNNGLGGSRSRRERVKQVATALGITPNDVYAALERSKKLGE